MNFCQNCGEPLKGVHNHCTECGHKIEQAPLQEDRVSKQTSQGASRKPLTKKQKRIGSIVAAIVILLGTFYLWGSSQVSAEKVAKRFSSAIQTHDAGALQKVTIVHHGKFISKGEADGLIALAKEQPDYIEMNMQAMSMAESYPGGGLFTIVENGKWLGLFKQYSILVTPQYVQLHLPFDGIESTFNGEGIQIKDSNEQIVVYGPMAPGIYDLESSFSGEYTEVNGKEKLTVLNEYSDPISHRVDLEAAYVTLHLDKGGAPISKAHVLLNDKKVDFDKDFKIEKFGPLKLDGKTTLIPVVELPWGEVKSEKVSIKEESIYIQPITVNKTMTESISDLTLAYGEEYMQAHAAWDTAKFTTITPEMKEGFQSYFINSKNNDELFSGKLEKVEIDLENVYYSEKEKNITGVEIPARFTFQTDTYFSGDSVNLTERIDSCDLELLYYQKDNSWKVDGCSSSWFGNEVNPTVTLEGSNKLYSPSNPGGTPADTKKTSNKDAKGESTIDFEDFMTSYNEKSVQALNSNDFSIVEPLIASNGPRLKEQRDYLDYIVSKGITEEALSTKVDSVTKTGNDKWEVVTIEEFMIHKKGSSNKKKFRTKNVIKKIDGQFQLYELLETKEL